MEDLVSSLIPVAAGAILSFCFGNGLVFVAINKTKGVKNRTSVNIASFLSPFALVAICMFSFWLFWILPFALIGVVWGTVTSLFRCEDWKDKQVGLSFLLGSILSYAFLLALWSPSGGA